MQAFKHVLFIQIDAGSIPASGTNILEHPMLMTFLTILVLAFFMYPIIDTFQNEEYKGWKRLGMITFILFTNWPGWLWIRFRKK